MPRRKAVQVPSVKGQCKDCPEGVSRLVRRPGPRCQEHRIAFTRAQKAVKHGRWILATYGITAEEYDAIYQAQGGKCAICQRATGASKRLSVDHDHKTGEVRGLCCTPCNRDVLGHLRDEVEAFRRCIRYLTDPPARAVIAQLRDAYDPLSTGTPDGVKPTIIGGGDTGTRTT